MKPAHIIILILVGTALAALGINYYFKKKAPSFDMDAYNRLGNNGIVQGNGDNPYCTDCNTNLPNSGRLNNSIDYNASGMVADPTFMARQAASMMS